MEYKLIAFDMDGTLLNSNKQISKKTQESITRAVEHNKIVILNICFLILKYKFCDLWNINVND